MQGAGRTHVRRIPRSWECSCSSRMGSWLRSRVPYIRGRRTDRNRHDMSWQFRSRRRYHRCTDRSLHGRSSPSRAGLCKSHRGSNRSLHNRYPCFPGWWCNYRRRTRCYDCNQRGKHYEHSIHGHLFFMGSFAEPSGYVPGARHSTEILWRPLRRASFSRPRPTWPGRARRPQPSARERRPLLAGRRRSPSSRSAGAWRASGARLEGDVSTILLIGLPPRHDRRTGIRLPDGGQEGQAVRDPRRLSLGVGKTP